MRNRYALALVTLSLLAACDSVGSEGETTEPATEQSVEACTGTIEWNTGSVPPPYNHGWTVELKDDLTVSFDFHANYVDDGDIYHADGIEMTAEQAANICDTFLSTPNKDFDGSGGDALVWVLNGTRGYVLESGPDTSDLQTRALDLVGDHWETAQQKYEEWRAANE